MVTVIEFDFKTKQERQVSPAQALTSRKRGRFCWIDLDLTEEAEAAVQLLTDFGVNQHVVQQATGRGVDSRHDLYNDCLHLTLTSVRFQNGKIEPSHVEVILGEGFLVTLRRGKVEFVEQVHRHYSQDFARFAETPSFLLYEYWDHLIESYKKALHELEGYVQVLQSEIFGEVNDEIFTRVSALTRDVLGFRKIMLGAREVLSELATRRSPFVSETTQPFLDRFVSTLERLCADLGVEREILAETLNLYMGMVSHRTNKVVNRLTILSTVFLPLTFLCGVYGMNFEILPELKWQYGYLGFWVVCVFLAVGLLLFMKKRKWW